MTFQTPSPRQTTNMPAGSPAVSAIRPVRLYVGPYMIDRRQPFDQESSRFMTEVISADLIATPPVSASPTLYPEGDDGLYNRRPSRRGGCTGCVH
jgi:hypothetical protein